MPSVPQCGAPFVGSELCCRPGPCPNGPKSAHVHTSTCTCSKEQHQRWFKNLTPGASGSGFGERDRRQAAQVCIRNRVIGCEPSRHTHTGISPSLAAHSPSFLASSKLPFVDASFIPPHTFDLSFPLSIAFAYYYCINISHLISFKMPVLGPLRSFPRLPGIHIPPPMAVLHEEDMNGQVFVIPGHHESMKGGSPVSIHISVCSALDMRVVISGDIVD